MKSRNLAKALLISFCLSLSFIFFPYYTVESHAQDFLNKETVVSSKDKGVVLLDRNGKPFFSFYSGKDREYIPLPKVPLHTQKAIIAIEDKDFYRHKGYSVKGIVRSVVANLEQGNIVSGGSTITQQLIKNTVLTPERNLVRKYQEITLATEMEEKFSKDDILEMYLNSVYFGEGALGIGQAVEYYYGKDIQNLNLAESAMLAAIIPAPSRLSPINGDLEEAVRRQKLVLQKMLEQGYITESEKNAAEAEKLHFVAATDDMNYLAPHFALMVREELVSMFGEETLAKSGFKVRTSIDLDWQKFAQQTVVSRVSELQDQNVSNGSAVVIDPKTGEVKALVGSIDWYNNYFGKVNVATSPRQPGSSFKPIVYAAAFEKGLITPASVLRDEPVTFQLAGSPSYKPLNYDFKFRGPVTVRRALSNSLNVPAVRVVDQLGVPGAVDMAQRLGISTIKDPTQYGLSLVLGAGEVKLVDLTGAYATFANQGKKNKVTTILDIEDKGGKSIYSYTPQAEQVIEPEYAFLISSILSDNRARSESFGNLLDISRPAAVKTGTTENFRDSLTMGYTPSLAVGVWVGNNDGTPMRSIAGSIGAAPIWKALMEEFLKNEPVENFSPPDKIVSVSACGGKTEFFVKGTEANILCPTPAPKQRIIETRSEVTTITSSEIKEKNDEDKDHKQHED